jgi:hypothetical protein
MHWMIGHGVVARSRTVQRPVMAMVMMAFMSEAHVHRANHEKNEGKHKNIITKSNTHECLRSVVSLQFSPLLETYPLHGHLRSLSAYLLMLAAARGRSRANRTSIAVSRRWQYVPSRSGDFTAGLFRRGATARPVRSESIVRTAPGGDAFIIFVRACVCACETRLRRRRARSVTSGAPTGARRLLGKTLPWPRPPRSRGGELSANKQCHCGEGNPSRSLLLVFLPIICFYQE